MSNVSHLWAIFLGTFIGLLPIINPLSAGPTFLAITAGDSEARRREQARKGCFYMVAILVSFLIGGTFIMNFFGISIPGLRIAGGILLTRHRHGHCCWRGRPPPNPRTRPSARPP